MINLPTNIKPKPLELIKKKRELIKVYESQLPDESITRAKNDPHSKRPPRWCGITVHVAHNCPYKCIYCYIQDMGFKHTKPKPYPLNGKELVLALLYNKAFFPGTTGTLIAIGSVSEPLAVPDHFLEYLTEISKLGNPIQFSTKAYIGKKMAEKIKEIEKGYVSKINPLVTIITLKHDKELEPFAPSATKRLETISNLREVGLRPVLFLRPIIPGINTGEIKEIMLAAKEAGAIGVVLGSFRITKRILSNLREAGFDTTEVEKRLRIIDDKQRAVPLPEKEDYVKLARNIGLIPWKSACCANSWNSGVPCASACFIDGPTTRCPNLCEYPRNSADEKELTEALNILGIKHLIKGKYVKILNYPFPGVEFAVRTLGRRGVIFSRKAKNERKKLKTST